MRIPVRPSLVILALVLGAGCTAETPSGTAATSASQPASANPSAAASEGAPSVPASAAASADELGPFTCDLPVHVDATVPRANLSGLTVAEEDPAYDRIAFEFIQGLPEVSIERAEPPFAHDASGAPIEVEGSSFLRIVMRGGTKQGDDGNSTYEGSTDLNPEFSMLTYLVEGGDFEGQSTWYVGLNAEACIRVLATTDEGAPRLVIDLEG